MGMPTHVVGFRPADEKWSNMKAIWDACDRGGAEVPDKVLKFFDHEYPGDAPGMEVELGDAVEDWADESASGYQVNLQKLPKDVDCLRFYNSY